MSMFTSAKHVHHVPIHAEIILERENGKKEKIWKDLQGLSFLGIARNNGYINFFSVLGFYEDLNALDDKNTPLPQIINNDFSLEINTNLRKRNFSYGNDILDFYRNEGLRHCLGPKERFRILYNVKYNSVKTNGMFSLSGNLLRVDCQNRSSK
ncbi:hypothetical protein M900_1841 [Bacteriovorax sp. Seq25_V]|nr:hypothetical protein M900_1841 [Bacteriovorax sp. Seq25_V]